MEAKGAVAAGLGFLGMVRLPLPLPEKLSSARTLRGHVSGYLGSLWRWRIPVRWWRPLLLLWVLAWALFAVWISHWVDSQAVEKRRDTLASMCDERARMLQDQFNVSMNHLQALAILVSTFHHAQSPSAINQVYTICSHFLLLSVSTNRSID